MAKILWDKFNPILSTHHGEQDFKKILKDTGNKLLVYHPTDRREGDDFWGDQYSKSSIVRKRRKMTWDFNDTKRYNDKGKGGSNYLGRLLMYIRNYFLIL